MQITKTFTFDTGHRLSNYEGKCKNFHGHTYHLEVTVQSENLDDLGMVMDFGILKKIVKEKILDRFDHKMLLKEDDFYADRIRNTFPSTYVQESFVFVPYNPTAENMALEMSDILVEALLETKKDVKLHNVRLYETPTSFVEVL